MRMRRERRAENRLPQQTSASALFQALPQGAFRTWPRRPCGDRIPDRDIIERQKTKKTRRLPRAPGFLCSATAAAGGPPANRLFFYKYPLAGQLRHRPPHARRAMSAVS